LNRSDARVARFFRGVQAPLRLRSALLASPPFGRPVNTANDFEFEYQETLPVRQLMLPAVAHDYR